MSEKNMMDILLTKELPEPKKKELRMKRLTDAFGEDFIVEIQELPYSKAAEIRELSEFDVHTLLAGVVNIKFGELKNRCDVETPAEVVKKLFQPGEIADISREIERLSGFRTRTWDEVKKKSGSTPISAS